jgi:hypothetical protein
MQNNYEQHNLILLLNIKCYNYFSNKKKITFLEARQLRDLKIEKKTQLTNYRYRNHVKSAVIVVSLL